VRQILIFEDTLLKSSTGKTGPSVAMINTSVNLPDNNFLFYKYMLKKRGYDVIFTGGILPASEVIEIHKLKTFDYLVVNSSAFDFARKKIGYFSSIGKSLLIKRIILTDYPEQSEKALPDNILITRTPSEFRKIIATLR